MKIFIECGISLNSPYSTGIQRVVRNIARESELVGQQLGFECIPVIFVGNSFNRYNLKSDRINSSLLGGDGIFLKVLRNFNNLLSRLPLKIGYSKFKIIVKPYIKSLYFKYATDHKFGIEDDVMGGRPLHYPPNKLQQDTVSAEEPNILLLLDSNWDSQMWDSVDKFRSEGGHVCAVLYDLVPFTHPETVEDNTREAHTSWWKEVPLHVDSVMCISQSVREDFLVWQQKEKFSSPIPAEKVEFFYLGAEYNQADPFIQVLSLDIPIFLVVGSLEPRKNHALILDAFEQLWEQGYEINLTVVGAHGWKSQEVIDRIKNHPELGQKLVFINDATDRDLVILYERSAALIIASLAEGFGLPIVEAFRYGTKVICSDIPVFREVAGDQAEYFEPTNAEALANKVSESVSSLRNGLYQKIGVTKEWITWKESTEQLFTRVLAIATNSASSPDSGVDNNSSKKIN
jgi:alpha-1,2-rhamnosyltransferase